MIGRLSGVLVEKDLRGVILDVGGVGYTVSMPIGDLTRCGALGEKVAIQVHTHVREDAIQLFGFLTREGKDAFTTLLNANGVGPKLALAILGALDPGELAAAIHTKDFTKLTSVPGVGRKTAERLCVELEGKLGAVTSSATPGMSAHAIILADLNSALVNLGYKPAQVDKVCKALEPQAKAGAQMDPLVREALKLLSGGGEKS